jgi:NADH-quinone oxidoreductase subunit C
LEIQAVKELIEKNLKDVSLKIVQQSLLIENVKDLPSVVLFLKENDALRLDYISSITGADYLKHLECVYHLYSMEKKGPLVTLRVRCHDRNKPVLPSITPIYRGAEFQEREAYDMYGFIFEGHPDLRRILMWDNFEGFPMRKDYVQEDSETLEHDDIEWLKQHDVKVNDDVQNKADELKRQNKRAVASPPTEGEK